MSKNESCCINKEDSSTFKEYWDNNYINNQSPNWIETQTPYITTWIDSLNLPSDATIFCAGVGNANIIQTLLEKGFTNIIANDISKVVLERLANTLNSSYVTYLNDDLIQPKKVHLYEGKVDLYIDRATLHFFTKCDEKDHYFNQKYTLLKPNGYSILGVFNKDNTPRCCGLDLQLWSLESLKNRMPQYDYSKESTVAFEERNGNIRNYIYLLSQKTK